MRHWIKDLKAFNDQGFKRVKPVYLELKKIQLRPILRQILFEILTTTWQKGVEELGKNIRQVVTS